MHIFGQLKFQKIHIFDTMIFAWLENPEHTGKSSFSLDEYAINCLCESFPMASKGEVSELYSKAKEEVKKNPMVCEPIKVKEHIAPIGYLCFDMLKKKFGEEKIIRRTYN